MGGVDNKMFSERISLSLENGKEKLIFSIEDFNYAFYLINSSLKLLWISKKIRQEFIKKRKILNQPCYKAFSKKEKICDNCPAVKTLKDGLISQTEKVLKISQYKKLFYLVTSYPIFNEKNEVKQVFLLWEDITNLKEVTNKVKYLDDLSKKIIENAPIAIFTLDRNGKIISTNHAHQKIEKICKESEKSIIGYDLINSRGSRRSGLSEYLRKGLRGTPFSLNDFHYIIYPEEKDLYLTIKGVPLKDRNGRIEGLICMIDDTTEKTKKDKEIARLKKFNESILQSITKGIMVVDREMNILSWNRGMELIFGFSSEKMIGLNVCSLFPNARAPYEDIKKVIETKNIMEAKGFKCQTEKRKEIKVNYKMFPFINDENGEIEGVTLFYEDVTQKEKTELKYQSMLETAGIGLFIANRTGKLVSTNKPFEEITGYAEHQVRRGSLFHLVNKKYHDKIRQGISDIFNNRALKFGPYEVEIINKNGDNIFVEITMHGIEQFNEVGTVQGMMRDLTYYKQLETRLITASKMSVIGEFAAGVAHEINNPLASIIGYSEESLDLLLGYNSNREYDHLRNHLEIIMNEGSKCKRLIRDLLLFGRRDFMTIEKVEVNEIIDETIQLLEHKLKKINKCITMKMDSNLPKIASDPWQLKQVFLNLLRNALDAVEEKGEVAVTTFAHNDTVKITISDTGKGIAKANLNKIFVPFFTTKPVGKGTGLGLSICYHRIKDLQGNIDVESKVNEGTTFIITLPLVFKSDPTSLSNENI